MVYDFHPIHVALNSSSLKPYQEFKTVLGDKPLTRATRADLMPFENKSSGSKTFLLSLLNSSRDFAAFDELLRAQHNRAGKSCSMPLKIDRRRTRWCEK